MVRKVRASVKQLKRFFKPTRKRLVKPHKPMVYFEIVLILIMTSTVLIIPTTDKATFYQEKYYEFRRYAENATDEYTREFWENQETRYHQRTLDSIGSLLFSSACAIVCLMGIFLYLGLNKVKPLEMASFSGLIALILSVLLLVKAIFS